MTSVSIGYSLLALVLLFFSCVWVGIGLNNASDRAYCFLTSIYTALWAIGVLLISLRVQSPGWLSFTVSNWVILAGFAVLVLAVETMYDLKLSTKFLTILVTVALLFFLIIGHDIEAHSKRLIILGAFSSLCCVMALYKGIPPLKDEHGYLVRSYVFLVGVGATVLWIFRLQLGQTLSVDELNLVSPTNFNLTALFIIWVICICYQGGILFLLIARNTRKIEIQSTQDFLTGAHNRLGMDKIRRSLSKQSMPISILLIDIDYFKDINDQYGHDAGDEVLKLVVTRARHNLRKEDFIIRFGGEEFIIIKPNSTLESAYQVAERVRQTIEIDPFKLSGSNRSIEVTVSIGVAMMDTVMNNRIDLEDVIKRADSALYKAKEQGRNQVIKNAHQAG